MDEAERCHELAYISYGRLLTRGTVAEVIAGAGLITWALSGEGLVEAGHRLRTAPGVRTVAPFGSTLHVSADSEAALKAATASLASLGQGLRITPIEPSLEDVFIALMQQAQDNFAVPAS
jgi:ABC-2 type transport system ATP-binding protein